MIALYGKSDFTIPYEQSWNAGFPWKTMRGIMFSLNDGTGSNHDGIAYLEQSKQNNLISALTTEKEHFRGKFQRDAFKPKKKSPLLR